MTLPRYALAYHECSVAELQTFIKQRTGRDAAGGLHKTDYIKTLHQIDLDVTFPFFDMLPEVRNLVYAEALRYDWNDRTGPKLAKSKASPQLLGASKQVDDEARGILYDESVATVHMVGSEAWEGHGYAELSKDVTAIVECKFDGVDCDASSLSAYKKVWPVGVLKVARIDLTIELRGTSDLRTSPATAQEYQHIFAGVHLLLDRLAYLARASSGQGRRNRICVVEPHDVMPAEILKGILRPLAKLCQLQEVRFDGMRPEVEHHLRSLAVSL